MMLRKMLIVTATSLLLTGFQTAQASEDVVMKAMEDELNRSMEQLQLEDLDKPYFISYRITETASTETAATFGSLLPSLSDRERSLSVEVRVGDRAMDNTNFLSFSRRRSGVLQGSFGRVALPLEDNYDEIRRQIWLATDAAYKSSVQDIAAKRAALQNKSRTEEIPDFSEEEVVTVTDVADLEPADLAKTQPLVRDLSLVFREMPEIYASVVRLRSQTVHTRFLNSEGTSYSKTRREDRLSAVARTQAEDGMPLAEFETAYGRTLAELPSKEELEERIRAMGSRLSVQRSASLLDVYNGPVLFEGQAAAELFAQVFVPEILASREPVTDQGGMGFFGGRGGSSFTDKIGARVLPRFLRLEDDPTMTKYDGEPLLGGFAVDDEGVPAALTTVVERGVLKTLLTTRTPVRGILKSSGSRRGSGPAPSNLVVTVDRGLTDDEMKEELNLLAQDRELEYGIVIRRIANPAVAGSDDPLAMLMSFSGRPGQSSIGGVLAAYKVFPDGREELIRNVELAEITATTFKEIVAASDSRAAYHLAFSGGGSSLAFMSFGGFGGPSAGPPIISVVTPALLFEDLTLKKPTGDIPNPPVVPHPYFEEEK